MSDAPQTLEQRLREGPVAPDEAVRIVWALCDRFEKGKTETFGDVSPARVRVTGRLVEAHIPDAAPVPGYSAPERATSSPTPRSDVYAAGALLVHLVSGKAYDGSPLPASATHLVPVLERCLALDPTARFASLSELKRALVRMDKTLTSGPKVPGDTALSRTSFGPWQLDGLLGQGSMGHVYKARHQALGRLAAIKVLRPEQYANRELIQRFFQEARTVNQINHEHIVEISDFVEEPGENGPAAVYCVMELLQGHTLNEEVETGPVSLQRALRIVEQLCDALAAAHRVGVVHRDVKPDNIMLITRGGSSDYVKVLDFGVAKLVDTSGKAVVATTEGAIIGTPICMSPEQAQGDDIDARSDIWAVGVILYRLLVGHFPFDAPTFVNIAVMICTKPFEPLPAKSVSGEAIPPGLKQLVEQCLQKSRDLRPPSMDVVRAQVRALLKGGPPEPTAKKPARSMIPWVVAGVLVLAGIAGFVGWRMLGISSASTEHLAVAPTVSPLPTLPVFDAGAESDAAAPSLDASVGMMPAVEDAGAGFVLDAGAKVKPPKPIKLSKETLPELLQKLLPKISGCVAKFPDQRTHLLNHWLVFEVQRSGKLANVHLEPAGPDLPVKGCIVDVISKSTFPPNDANPAVNRPRVPLKFAE